MITIETGIFRWPTPINTTCKIQGTAAFVVTFTGKESRFRNRRFVLFDKIFFWEQAHLDIVLIFTADKTITARILTTFTFCPTLVALLLWTIFKPSDTILMITFSARLLRFPTPINTSFVVQTTTTIRSTNKCGRKASKNAKKKKRFRFHH